MAKKKISKKTPEKKAHKPKQSRHAVERVLTKGPIRTRPRAQPLPGMEDARIAELDDVADSIADVQEQQNTLADQAKQLKATALLLMHQHKKQVWKHNGVELTRAPEGEKLRVRLVKSESAHEEDDGPGEVFAEDAQPPADERTDASADA